MYCISNTDGSAYLNTDRGEWVEPDSGDASVFSFHGRIEYENVRLIPQEAHWVEINE